MQEQIFQYVGTKYGINENEFNVGQGINISTTTVSATTTTTTNNNKTIHFFLYSSLRVPLS
jgi:uncharacterized membrane protein